MVLDFSRNLILTKLSESTKCKALIFFFIILLLQGGLGVCSDAILLGLWCSFEGIFILSCGIAVLQNQAVCSVWKFLGNFNAVCSFLCYSVWCLNIQVVYFCCFAVFIPPLHCTPPSFSLAFYQGRINQGNMVCHTYNHKKKLEELFTLSSELPFLADLVF